MMQEADKENICSPQHKAGWFARGHLDAIAKHHVFWLQDSEICLLWGQGQNSPCESLPISNVIPLLGKPKPGPLLQRLWEKSATQNWAQALGKKIVSNSLINLILIWFHCPYRNCHMLQNLNKIMHAKMRLRVISYILTNQGMSTWYRINFFHLLILHLFILLILSI